MKIFILHINIVVNIFQIWNSYLSPGSITLKIIILVMDSNLFENNNFCK